MKNKISLLVLLLICSVFSSLAQIQFLTYRPESNVLSRMGLSDRFYNEQNYFPLSNNMVINSGESIFTKDGGKTWYLGGPDLPKNSVRLMRSYNNTLFGINYVTNTLSGGNLYQEFCINTYRSDTEFRWRKINLRLVTLEVDEYFVSQNNEYIITSNATNLTQVFKSSDGGVSWANINFPSKGKLVDYLDGNELKWKIRSYSDIKDYFYLNGTWTNQTISPSSERENYNEYTFGSYRDVTQNTLPIDLKNKNFVFGSNQYEYLNNNSLTGFILLHLNSPQTIAGLTYLYTSDGGVSWQRGNDLTIPAYASGNDNDPASFEKNIYYTTDNSEWISIHPISLKVCSSNNQGQSWNVKYDNAIKASSYYFKDKNTLFYGKDSKIYRSTNGGQTFTQQFSGTYTFGFNSFNFAEDNSGYGYAFGNQGTILKSTDNGSTWAVLLTFPNTDAVLKGHFFTKDYGFVLANGTSGTSTYTTRNGGASWQKMYDFGTIQGYGNYDITLFKFKNKFILYCLSGIYTSSDSSKTWSKYSSLNTYEHKIISSDTCLFIINDNNANLTRNFYMTKDNFSTPIIKLDYGVKSINAFSFMNIEYSAKTWVYLMGGGLYRFKPHQTVATSITNPASIPTLCGTFSNNGKITFGSSNQSGAALSGTRGLWSFDGKSGTSYTISNCGGNEDTKLRIYSSSGNIVADNDDSPKCDKNEAEITWNCTQNGTYYILLTNYDCDVLDRNQTN